MFSLHSTHPSPSVSDGIKPRGSENLGASCVEAYLPKESLRLSVVSPLQLLQVSGSPA